MSVEFLGIVCYDKREDIMVVFRGLSQATTQAATQATTQAAENAIPVRMKKVIREEPSLSRRQMAAQRGEKQ